MNGRILEIIPMFLAIKCWMWVICFDQVKCSSIKIPRYLIVVTLFRRLLLIEVGKSNDTDFLEEWKIIKLDLFKLRDKRLKINQLLIITNSLFTAQMRLLTSFPEIYIVMSSAYNNNLITLDMTIYSIKSLL